MAVLVRHPSGADAAFAATLEALAAQDYPDLRVVVVDAGSGDDLSDVVHDILPHATIHRLAGNPGFGAAANVVVADDGHEIQYFLFCHDDIVPEPGTTRGLVDAARLWHAAVVGPKLVRWDDSRRITQLGEAVTKTGVTVPLVDPGELDQGQHDIVREAFTVPGACTLVRADVFRRIGGFDEAITFLADDLSLCWRARLAGARVVVEPSVRVRHQARLSQHIPRAQQQRLRARHRLRVVLGSYGPADLLQVVPQAAVASLVEAVVSLLRFRPSRAKAALAAWTWNLRRLGTIRQLRGQVAELRQVDDSVIRRLQAPGVIRPQLRRPVDVSGGSGDQVPSVEVDEATVLDVSWTPRRPWRRRRRARRSDDRGLGATPTGQGWASRMSDRLEKLRSGWTSGGVVVLLALVGVLLLGSRHLVTRGVPSIGQLVGFGTPDELVDEWLSGWRTTGLGSDTAAPTALGALGGLGTLVTGHMGLLRLLLTLGLVPLGIVGAFRMLRPSGSPRAPVAAAVAYACLPVPYAALVQGRWAPLATYAAAPWLLAQLGRAGGLVPQRRGTVVQVLRLGLLTALLGLVLPAAPLLLLFLATALLLGSLVAFQRRGSLRLVGAAVGGALTATVLQLPWSFDVVRSWWDAGQVAPVSVPGAGSPAGPLDLLRDDTAGSSWSVLWWALPAAAGLVLLVGRRWRLAWGIRGWVVALASWGGAWAAGQQGAQDAVGVPLPEPGVLLALAGTGLALAVGMSVAAVQHDVVGRSRRFGLRRSATALALVALAVATVPLLWASLDGYWGMPPHGFDELLGEVEAETTETASRVLWVGDAAMLPIPGWPVAAATDDQQRLAYATSEGLPHAADLWPGPLEAPTDRIGSALQLAMQRRTSRLGGLLAPMAVEYVAVPRALAPTSSSQDVDEQGSFRGLATALDGQLDLERVDVDAALLLYRNTAALPGRAVLQQPAPPAPLPGEASPRQLREIAALDAEPALATRGYDRAGGELPAGTLFQSVARSDRWRLVVDGTTVAPNEKPAFGWATSYAVEQGGAASLSYDTPVTRYLLLGLQVALWLVATSLALVPRGRGAGRRLRRAERRAARQPRHRARSDQAAPSAAEPEADDEAPVEVAPEQPVELPRESVVLVSSPEAERTRV
jgi:GT2 family glycosyltransferase